MARVKLQDVAKLAGVSVTTVSRVLNNRGYLSKQTINKVHQAMEELNYRPNAVARQLYKQRTDLVGLVFPTVNNPFFGQLEAELERVLSQVAGAGQVQVLLTYATTAESTPAREEKIEESNGNSENTVSRESTVVLMENGSGGQSPLILTETAPQVEGVLIVAQGAGDPVVCDGLSRAAQALLQVPAHKIAILKMK